MPGGGWVSQVSATFLMEIKSLLCVVKATLETWRSFGWDYEAEVPCQVLCGAFKIPLELLWDCEAVVPCQILCGAFKIVVDAEACSPSLDWQWLSLYAQWNNLEQDDKLYDIH